jgi:hypothetical protein
MAKQKGACRSTSSPKWSVQELRTQGGAHKKLHKRGSFLSAGRGNVFPFSPPDK